MSDPGPAGEYAPTESFESGPVTAKAADDERVVLGTEVGTVEIVEADGRTTVEFDAPVDDLAVGKRVYALADGAVTALSTAGTRVWSVELPAARELAALPEADVLGVVTADDELVGFDGETGGEEFRVDRPHADVTDDPGFFGTDGAFVLVAWSFLAVRNLDGSERFDENLDGAIESAGIVDDTVVASLKDERVVGVNAMTGERQWERELAVTDLPDRGDEALLFTADGQLVSLAPDGSYDTVADLPSGDVYPTSDGGLFCAVSDGTVAVYCATGDPTEALSVSVDEDLVPGGTDAVELAVENAGERPVAATLGVEGEGVALRADDWAVDLAPGESATRSLGVESVSAGDTAAIAVTAGGDHLASLSLPVVDAPGGALDADAELDAVLDGAASLTVVVENAGDAPATDVSVSPGDAGVGRLVPGETATVAVETPFDAGSDVPVSVRAADARADADVPLPAPVCDLSVEATDDGFVDVVVENPTDATLADDLAVDGDPFDAPVERRVELGPGGRFVLALRPDRRPSEADVDVGLAGLGVGETVRLDGLAARGRRDPQRRDSRRRDPDRRERGREPRPEGRRDAGRRDDARPRRDEDADYRPRRDDSRRDERRPRDERPPRRDSGRRDAARRGDGRADRPPRDGAEPPREEPAPPRRDRDDPPRRGRNDPPRRDREGDGRRDAGARRPDEDSTGRASTEPSARRDPEDSTARADDGTGSAGAGAGAVGGTAGGGDAESGSADAALGGATRGSGSSSASAHPSGGSGSSSGARLSADRTLEDDSPERTQGVRERVTVTNESEAVAEDVAVSFPDGAAPLGDLAPDESATVERHHAFADTGTVELPAGTVAVADAAEVRLDERRLTVSPAEFAVDAAVEGDDDGHRVRLELANHRDAALVVDRIGVREVGVWDTDLRVPAGETVEWTRRVAAPDVAADAVEAAVEYAFEDRDPGQWGTLARIPDADEADPDGPDALSVEVGEETRVSGGYGSVVLVVENAASSPVEDVAVEAGGEDVSELMYGGGESGLELAPGETVTHFVDVETEGDATVPVTLSVGDESDELTLSGPAPADEADWSAGALAAWQVEREGETGGDDARVASAFEPV
ncbi:outer membrane protein assembly factor BamB family protein [Halorussus halobius]|uniref:outer membrane protein assembly factor BamB family protein n=1 Tax=Halorussus halobius TaxID=1710537 RepID=UPI001092F5A2|nr:PQQ-binding-like beta-propeller repeat protein [Halorussus halobius]